MLIPRMMKWIQMAPTIITRYIWDFKIMSNWKYSLDEIHTDSAGISDGFFYTTIYVVRLISFWTFWIIWENCIMHWLDFLDITHYAETIFKPTISKMLCKHFYNIFTGNPEYYKNTDSLLKSWCSVNQGMVTSTSYMYPYLNQTQSVRIIKFEKLL